MTISSYLFIEGPPSLENLVTLIGFSKDLPHVIDNEIEIEINHLIVNVLIISDEDYDWTATYGIRSSFRIGVSHFDFMALLQMTEQIIRQSPYNLGVFMSYSDRPLLIRREHKLILNSNPNAWIEEWLDIFKDIPYETTSF